MRDHLATVLSVFTPHPEATLLRLEAPTLAGRLVPGQYVMAARAGQGWDPFLRQPLFVAGQESETGTVTLWVPGGAEEREPLRALPLHSTLSLLGPLGSGLAERAAWRQLLLVAEGLAVGPLLAIIERAVAAGRSVALLGVVPPDQLPYPPDALPLSVEYQRAPRGGAGIAAQELLRWADGVVAAGSQRFYQDLADELRAARPGQRGGFAYGLLLEPFGWSAEQNGWAPASVACGLAACRACLVPLRRRKVVACHAGPLFDLWSL